MSYGKISKKQEEILNYIKSQILERGFPPAVREICEAVNLKSTSSVHSHLETLERNGYIHRDPTKPRAIEILDDSFNLTRREMTTFRSSDMWLPESLFWHRNILKTTSRSQWKSFRTNLHSF